MHHILSHCRDSSLGPNIPQKFQKFPSVYSAGMFLMSVSLAIFADYLQGLFGTSRWCRLLAIIRPRRLESSSHRSYSLVCPVCGLSGLYLLSALKNRKVHCSKKLPREGNHQKKQMYKRNVQFVHGKLIILVYPLPSYFLFCSGLDGDRRAGYMVTLPTKVVISTMAIKQNVLLAGCQQFYVWQQIFSEMEASNITQRKAF